MGVVEQILRKFSNCHCWNSLSKCKKNWCF